MAVNIRLVGTELARAIRAEADSIADPETPDHPNRRAADLLYTLALIAQGHEVAAAFGAPGDWGYGTPIGDALAGRLGSRRSGSSVLPGPGRDG